MGIFERAIPKYTYNMANEVVVEPQDVYVDDIFDPIFNAKVKEAMRQKYGDGLYGIAGGYGELLKNTWTGDHGSFGPKMGVLSTFGRSMDKADDIILGALTEGIKGVSGQGSTGPLKNIFVNDHNYTGREFLAATANIGRNLVGTTVDESDFGPAWTVPAIGVELATDVGILGGGLSRTFAPHASRLTSKELFENLGKSDLKTTVGEFGQLMYNYDNLMAKIALDITAPGLRPALRKFINKLATYIPHHSYRATADYTKTADDAASGTARGTASATDSSFDTAAAASSPTVEDELTTMYERMVATYDSLPVSSVEEFSKANRLPSEIIAEVAENAPSNVLNSDLKKRRTKKQRKSNLSPEDQTWFRVDSAFKKYNKDFGEAIEKVIGEAQSRWKKSDIGDLTIDRSQPPISEDAEELRNLLRAEFLAEYNDEAFKVHDWKLSPDQAPSEPGWWNASEKSKFLALARQLPTKPDDPDAIIPPDAITPKELRLLEVYSALSGKDETDLLEGLQKESLKAIANKIDLNAPSAHYSKSKQSVNKTYITEFIEKISTDEGLLDGLMTGEWTSNDAFNNTIDAFVWGSKNKTNRIVKQYSSQFNLSPSEFARLNYAGEPGLATVRNELREVVPFKSEEEFDDFFESDNMFAALNAMFPPINATHHDKFVDYDAFNDSRQMDRVEKFKTLLKKVVYPGEVNVKQYNSDLKDLVEYVDKYATSTAVGTPASLILDMVPEEAEYLANLYKTLDAIQTHYVQPIQGLPKRSLDFTGRRAEFYFQNAADDVGIDADLAENYEGVAQALMSKLSPYIASEDDLDAIYSPLKPFMELKIKKGNRELYNPNLNPKTTHKKRISFEGGAATVEFEDKTLDSSGRLSIYDPKSAAYDKSLKTTKRYYKEALPIVEEYVMAGGSIYTDRFKPKGWSDAKFDKFKSLLGKDGVEPDPDAKDFYELTRMLFPGYWKDEPVFKAKYPENVDLRDTEFYTLAKSLKTHIFPPDKLEQFVLNDKWFLRSERRALEHGMSTSTIRNEVANIARSLERELPDIGIKDTSELETLLDKVNTTSSTEMRKSFAKLSPSEKRKLHAYALKYESAVAQLPYHVIDRDYSLVSAENGFQLIHSTVTRRLKDKKMAPRVAGRIRALLSAEEDVNFAKHGYDTAFSKYTDANRILLSELLPEYGNTLYRDTYLGELPAHFDVPRMEEFLEKFRIATREDADATKIFRAQDDKLAEYYRAKGEPYRKINTNVYDARNALCKIYFSMPYKQNETAINDIIAEYLEATDLDLARAERISAAKSNLPTRYPYTKANVEYVKKHVIDHLEYRYRIAWKPSPQKGLFYFDIAPGEQATAMRVKDTFDIRRGDFQRRLRTGKTYEELMKDDEKIRPVTNYIAYDVLQSYTQFDKLAKRLADKHLYMKYITVPEKPIAEVTLDALRKRKLDAKGVEATVAEIEKTLESAPAESLVETTFNPPSIAETAVSEVIKETIGEDAYDFIKKSPDPETAKTTVGEESWNLYRQINRANAVGLKNSVRDNRATGRIKANSELLSNMEMAQQEHLNSGGTFSDFRRLAILRQQPVGDVILGSDFWEDFMNSGSYIVPFARGSERTASVLDSLTHNAKLINTAVGHNVVKLEFGHLNDDVDVVKMYFDTEDTEILVKIGKAVSKLDAAKFDTVMFSPPTPLSVEDMSFLNTPTISKISKLLDDAKYLAADMAKWLGFTFDTSEIYTKHAMSRNVETAEWFNDNIYTNFKSEDIDDIVNGLANLDAYRSKTIGTFGTSVKTRRFRGDYWLLDNGPETRFNYAPFQLAKSTFVDGAFANIQFQSCVDLFINDNFKVKPWFKTPEELKKVFHEKLPDGSESGNLRNLELCSLKFDSTGKIVGIIKHDKLSDKGLADALAADAIVVPANAVSYMDSLLRKDIRMSNKLWMFLNKRILPFKFGVLTNPGFLIGNLNDAYLKIATTMCQKYGTTLEDEAAKLAETMNLAKHCKENYYTAFDEYRKMCEMFEFKLDPEATVPDIVAMQSKYSEMFLDWLNGTLVVKTETSDVLGHTKTSEVIVPCNLSNDVKNAASIWVLLQNVQMSTDKLKEFSELADLEQPSKYTTPVDLYDRITRGKGKYDVKKPSTWGIFMNNPIMRGTLKVSTGIEDVVRTSAVLDDLMHGYTFEELGSKAKNSKWAFNDDEFGAHVNDAKNAMYNANFDYSRQSDFTDGVGTFVPFPTFFLKNFVYWMELLLNNPQYVDNAIDVQEGLWSGRDEENSEDTFEAEAKGRGAIPVGGDALPDWFRGFYKPSPLQSMFGAFNLLNSPVDDMRYRLNPIISGGAAMAAKKYPTDLTTSLAPAEETKYRPYSTDMYERNIKSSDPNFNPFEYALHRANPYERAINTHLRTPQKIREGDAQLSDFVPSVFQPDF